MGWLVLVIVVFFFLLPCLRIVKEWERGVLLRLGRFDHVKEPGIRFVWPIIDSLRIIDTRIITMDVPKQEIITRDNVSVMVDAVVFYQVIDAERAITKVENWNLATMLRSQTALRSVIGQAEMDEVLSEREKLNVEIQTIIDHATDPWGIKVTVVEVKDVVLPDSMKRVMANQAETERMRRAKVINAEGELQASEKLAQAASVLSVNPQALQLRFLQTLTEVGSEQNSTIVFPVPIDLLTAFMKAADSIAGQKTD